ncbi:SDR family NAD(P)-dependent oxidoreductase [Bradyrhizobium uaiense]|uniref:SDR family NAD(P)-dependent oxidoreductase n=1 Tax=Bradyrhizobium uaiense TaxID=2594946 RepID=UPI001F43DD97|nr:SDR family oxidoreductase [Bradyrhizobium uaiense]
MRVSIITGGGSGIGAAVARRLAGPGQSLMLHGQGAEATGLARLNSVAEECRSKGAKVEIATGDLAAAGAGIALVEAARAAFGPIDTIVHAAGFADRREFASLPREALERAFAVMAAAFHEIATAALSDLKRSARGRVVAVSSFGPHRFVPGATYPGSAAAKAALEVLVKSLAIELASSGATANAVMPGYTRKDPGLFGALDSSTWERVAKANPMQRLADAAETAAVGAFPL